MFCWFHLFAVRLGLKIGAKSAAYVYRRYALAPPDCSHRECNSIAEQKPHPATPGVLSVKIRKAPQWVFYFFALTLFRRGPMRTIKLIISYEGSDFCGWQIQPASNTIQGALSSAIGRVTGENVLPQGSGRTDAGVHALAQVASFTTSSPIPVNNFVTALNDVLPPSIRVCEATEAAPGFHARKSARAKTYQYRIFRGAICSPFLARYVWHYPYPLAEQKMAEAAAVVIGEHDFTSFAAVDAERNSWNESNLREILSSEWKRDGEILVYTVRGNGFLHHMVRNLVGTLLMIGKGTLQLEDVSRILLARNRSAAAATAPAQGLYLVNVEY